MLKRMFLYLSQIINQEFVTPNSKRPPELVFPKTSSVNQNISTSILKKTTKNKQQKKLETTTHM